MHLHRPFYVVSTLALLAPLSAQSVVVPASNANTRGTTQLNSIIRNAGNPRTYMLGTSVTELLTVPVGATLVGVSLRFQNHASMRRAGQRPTSPGPTTRSGRAPRFLSRPGPAPTSTTSPRRRSRSGAVR